MADISNLPPLRDVITSYTLNARKALGQNFLLDLNLTQRIARSAAPLRDHVVVEVGPGPGGLTRALLLEGAAHVLAIEKDKRCIDALESLVEAAQGRLSLIEGDALTANPLEHIPKVHKHKPIKIIANLPYNVGTLLLTNWLGGVDWPSWFSSLTLMFQKEVAQRLIAQPDSKAYGRLSVLAQARCDVQLMFHVAPSAFVPPPKVTSAIVQLVPKQPKVAFSISALETVTQAAFGQRRKMLRSSLKPLFADRDKPLGDLLAGVNVQENVRAETLSVDDFIALANLYAPYKSSNSL